MSFLHLRQKSPFLFALRSRGDFSLCEALFATIVWLCCLSHKGREIWLLRLIGPSSPQSWTINSQPGQKKSSEVKSLTWVSLVGDCHGNQKYTSVDAKSIEIKLHYLMTSKTNREHAFPFKWMPNKSFIVWLFCLSLSQEILFISTG